MQILYKIKDIVTSLYIQHFFHTLSLTEKTQGMYLFIYPHSGRKMSQEGDRTINSEIQFKSEIVKIISEPNTFEIQKYSQLSMKILMVDNFQRANQIIKSFKFVAAKFLLYLLFLLYLQRQIYWSTWWCIQNSIYSAKFIIQTNFPCHTPNSIQFKVAAYSTIKPYGNNRDPISGFHRKLHAQFQQCLDASNPRVQLMHI
eukprot:TRINITY_DN7298_c0_g2_i3.p1 TRINITY_DN7298_c0_g2~~TRINITY_DN7298_c0_g2_i3.p1  ORF type:complete len:200 (-),score=-6.05 TRINITY_DN7298_c0_g2_i3:659-1258(-)